MGGMRLKNAIEGRTEVVSISPRLYTVQGAHKVRPGERGRRTSRLRTGRPGEREGKGERAQGVEEAVRTVLSRRREKEEDEEQSSCPFVRARAESKSPLSPSPTFNLLRRSSTNS